MERTKEAKQKKTISLMHMREEKTVEKPIKKKIQKIKMEDIAKTKEDKKETVELGLQ